MTIKLLVLDLDGTIALTEKYDGIIQQRNPSVILQEVRPGESGKHLLASEFLPKFLSDCLKCGVEVIVITRSPKAYASTLLNILGLDYLECRPHPGYTISRADKLRALLVSHKLDPSEMLYIGDEIGDMQAAREANCKFSFPGWTRGSPDITSMHRENSDFSIYQQFKKDISNALTEVSAITNPYLENRAKWNKLRRDKVLNLAPRPRVFQNVTTSISDAFWDQGDEYFFNKDFNTNETFRPILNGRFCTRYDYETDLNIKIKLMAILRQRFPRYKYEFSRNLNPAKTRFSAHVHYKSALGDSLWNPCKNWKGKKSGPDVHQHLMEFVALVMASHLVEEPVKPYLIPVPSTEFSLNQPAENSLRLAHRISELSGCPILPLLKKDENRNIAAITNVLDLKPTYLLIDDQMTSGKTMLKCKEYLSDHFRISADFYVWSHLSADLQLSTLFDMNSIGIQCQTCGFANEVDANGCAECGTVTDYPLATIKTVIPQRYLNVIEDYESLTGESLTDAERIQFSKNQSVGQLSQNASDRRVASGMVTREFAEDGKFKLDLLDWASAMYEIPDPRAKTHNKVWVIDEGDSYHSSRDCQLFLIEQSFAESRGKVTNKPQFVILPDVVLVLGKSRCEVCKPPKW